MHETTFAPCRNVSCSTKNDSDVDIIMCSVMELCFRHPPSYISYMLCYEYWRIGPENRSTLSQSNLSILLCCWGFFVSCVILAEMGMAFGVACDSQVRMPLVASEVKCFFTPPLSLWGQPLADSTFEVYDLNFSFSLVLYPGLYYWFGTAYPCARLLITDYLAWQLNTSLTRADTNGIPISMVPSWNATCCCFTGELLLYSSSLFVSGASLWLTGLGSIPLELFVQLGSYLLTVDCTGPILLLVLQSIIGSVQLKCQPPNCWVIG